MKKKRFVHIKSNSHLYLSRNLSPPHLAPSSRSAASPVAQRPSSGGGVLRGRSEVPLSPGRSASTTGPSAILTTRSLTPPRRLRRTPGRAPERSYAMMFSSAGGATGAEPPPPQKDTGAWTCRPRRPVEDCMQVQLFLYMGLGGSRDRRRQGFEILNTPHVSIRYP